MKGLSFSWKRLVGISGMKTKIARKNWSFDYKGRLREKVRVTHIKPPVREEVII